MKNDWLYLLVTSDLYFIMTTPRIFDIKRLFIGGITAAFFAGAIVVLTKTFGTNVGVVLVDTFGLLGIYLGLLFIDTIPTPGGAIPILTLALQGGLSPFILGLTCLFASYCAGFIGYATGKTFGFPQTWRERLEKRYPNAFAKMHSHERSSFLILVALPIPMSLAAWIGASFSLTLRAFCLGALIRIPKIILYLFATYSSVQFL